VVKATD
jgi:hypothetical protein